MGKNGKWSALALLVLGIRAELCLDDGVPEAQRQYIQDDAGMDMPIGFLVCAWQSSEFLTLLTSMLTEEVFGFHTRHHPVVGGNGAAPIYALAGCTDFNNVTDRGCHGDETQVHVSVDSWVGSYASARRSSTGRTHGLLLSTWEEWVMMGRNPFTSEGPSSKQHTKTMASHWTSTRATTQRFTIRSSTLIPSPQ